MADLVLAVELYTTIDGDQGKWSFFNNIFLTEI